MPSLSYIACSFLRFNPKSPFLCDCNLCAHFKLATTHSKSKVVWFCVIVILCSKFYWSTSLFIRAAASSIKAIFFNKAFLSAKKISISICIPVCSCCQGSPQAKSGYCCIAYLLSGATELTNCLTSMTLFSQSR